MDIRLEIITKLERDFETNDIPIIEVRVENTIHRDDSLTFVSPALIFHR